MMDLDVNCADRVVILLSFLSFNSSFIFGKYERNISTNNLSVDMRFPVLRKISGLITVGSSKNEIISLLVNVLLFVLYPSSSRKETTGCSEIILSIMIFEFWFIHPEIPVSPLLDRHYTPLFIHHLYWQIWLSKTTIKDELKIYWHAIGIYYNELCHNITVWLSWRFNPLFGSLLAYCIRDSQTSLTWFRIVILLKVLSKIRIIVPYNTV